MDSELNFFQSISNHRKAFIIQVVADFYVTVL